MNIKIPWVCAENLLAHLRPRLAAEEITIRVPVGVATNACAIERLFPSQGIEARTSRETAVPTEPGKSGRTDSEHYSAFQPKGIREINRRSATWRKHVLERPIHRPRLL